MKKNNVFMLMLVLALSVVLAACGTSEDNTSGAEGDKGFSKLSVGTEATFAPFESMTDKGEIVGIDVDVMNAIGAEVDAEVEFKNVGWEPVFQQVTNKELDLGASGITITEERKKTFDFTDPYYEATLMIVVKEDSPIKTLDELKDKKISVQINTTGHEAAKDLQGITSTNILAYENQPIAFQEVINGTAAASIGDNAVVLEYLKNNPKSGLKAIESDQFEKEYYGFMVKKGNKELLDLLNEGLKKIKENGKLEEITGQKID
ncbi:basic amino acid ABC transporter substrate-binding protein [Lysinibacillus sp. 2017]|uniref:basic amino acid ABC transporter substrate-binding protein n=1 Tax=unclassified Lysinibacillus TaxID=2636778 RepID=UPI000D52616D|nr:MULTISPECIES: basic amino acid ABC transporter substrate-binding protein [unclassified Lysinibacillus]AWE09315.1 basic amino acid ABC transporter substrate-binding protein [Lysinibacillus sp. 2017]TGN35725.1 basic amino acid ABC transporter substrate-binding protein [Lysinibacillus sp. S2017]